MAARNARDSQKSKLYRAEKAVHGRDFDSVEDMQRYVDKIMGYAWFKRRWPALRYIEVRDGRGQRNALAKWGNVIAMPRWSRYELVVLHEMAHHCADRQYGRRGVPAHGWQFAGVLVELVRYAMGKEEADKLKASFREAKVRFTEPKKRKPLSPEQREANVARLAAAREKREATKEARIIHYTEHRSKPYYRTNIRYMTGVEYLVMAKTKKAAAEMLGVDYSEFVKDSRWVDNPAQGPVHAGTFGAAFRDALNLLDEDTPVKIESVTKTVGSTSPPWHVTPVC